MKTLLPADAKFELENVTGWDTSEGSLDVHGKIRMPNAGQITGRRLLLPLGLYLAGQPQLFSTADRKQDIYFRFPYETVDDFTIHIPETWSPAQLPGTQKLSPGTSLNYLISAEVSGKTVHVQRKLSVGDVLYPAMSYLSLRAFFRTARADDEQQLVLQTGSASNNN